jgi:hypothetical protein
MKHIDPTKLVASSQIDTNDFSLFNLAVFGSRLKELCQELDKKVARPCFVLKSDSKLHPVEIASLLIANLPHK